MASILFDCSFPDLLVLRRFLISFQGDMGVGKSCLLHQFTEKKCKYSARYVCDCEPWSIFFPQSVLSLTGHAFDSFFKKITVQMFTFVQLVLHESTIISLRCGSLDAHSKSANPSCVVISLTNTDLQNEKHCFKCHLFS